MSRRLLVLIPLLVIALAGSAMAGTWYWAQGALEDGWQDWLDDHRARGYRFENVEPTIGGFPDRVTARLDAPRVVAPQGWTWQAPQIRGEAQVWSPLTLRFNAPGKHLVTPPVGAQIIANAGAAAGRVDLAPREGVRSGRLDIADVTVEGLPLGAIVAETLHLHLAPARAAHRQGVEVLDFTGTITGLVLPSDLDTPLDDQVERVELRARAVGELPRRAEPDAVHAWREAGGVVEVDHVRLDWPPLRLTGDGELGLDSELRPLGTLMVEATGLDAALERFAQAGIIDSRAANYAKLAVMALGTRDDSSGEVAIRLPLSFQEGRLYLGPVPLARLSPVLEDRTTQPDALR